MASSDERLKILQMVQDGKISAEDGVKLMEALGDTPPPRVKKRYGETQSHPPRGPVSRWLRICVTDQYSGKVRVNIRLPINVVTVGAKLGARFSPEVEGLDMKRLMASIQAGQRGKIYSTIDESDDEKVEVFLE